MIVSSSEPVTLLGAGPLPSGALDEALARAPRLVAADGGAAHALATGRIPDATIGDLDSLPAEVLSALPPGRVHRIDDQDTTDFEKCLGAVAAPLVLAVGFTGARLDHELAAFSALLAFSDRTCILIGSEDVVFAAPADVELDLPEATRVSLFPFAEVRGESSGLRWDIAGLTFRPGGRIGTSNAATGGPVRLCFDAPGMLVLLPRDCLDAAIRGVAPPPTGRAGARGG